MTVRTTRLKATQAPKVDTLDLSPQLDGRTQIFTLPRKVYQFDRHYLVWNSTVYNNDVNHNYYTISSDGKTLTTHFDRSPLAGPAHTLQLVVDMGGDSTDNIPTKADIETAITSEANLREAADEKLDADIKAEALQRESSDNTIKTELENSIAAEANARTASDDELRNKLLEEESARQSEDDNLQAQIDAITSASDVADVVQSKKDLDDYDKSTLDDNDIIKVLKDETQDNATSYYRWQKESKIFDLIGVTGPYYTTAEVDKKILEVEGYITDYVGDIDKALKDLISGGGINGD